MDRSPWVGGLFATLWHQSGKLRRGPSRWGGWQGEVTFVLCVLFTFGLGFSAFLLLPKYLTEVGAGARTIGAMTSAMSCAVVVTTPISAHLVERQTRPFLVRLGAVVLGASSLGFLAVPAPGFAMVVLRFAQGSAFSLVLTACSATVVERSPHQRLGRLLGLLGATLLVCQALAPALFEPLTESLGWSALFVGGALVASLVALASFAFPDPLPRLGPKTEPSGSVLFRPRGMVSASLVASMATGFSYGAVITFGPTFALSRGASSISSLFLGYTTLALSSRMALGGLGDARGHVRVAVTSVTVYSAVVLCFAKLQPGWLPWLGAGLGLSHGLLFPSLNVLALTDTPPEQRGRLQAFFFGAFHLGVAAAGLLLGAVATAAGFPTTFVLAGAVSLAAGLYLAVAAHRGRVASAPPSNS